MMYTTTTHDIRVSVKAIYQPMYSKPLKHEYIFAYKVIIENLGGDEVQLLRRHWYIFDSNGLTREVEGEGVVGEQPILGPGDVHEYVSGCPLSTPIGYMKGTYLMKRTSDGKSLDVVVPRFEFIAPFKGN